MGLPTSNLSCCHGTQPESSRNLTQDYCPDGGPVSKDLYTTEHPTPRKKGIPASTAANEVKIYETIWWLSLPLDGVPYINVQQCYNKGSFKQDNSDANSPDLPA